MGKTNFVGLKQMQDLVLRTHLFLQRFYSRFLLQPNGVSFFCKTFIRSIVTEFQTILRTRGKHPIGFVYSLCYKIIYHDANICFVAFQNKWMILLFGFSTARVQRSINPGDNTLTSSFFIAGCSVNLTCRKEPAHPFCLQINTKLYRE